MEHTMTIPSLTIVAPMTGAPGGGDLVRLGGAGICASPLIEPCAGNVRGRTLEGVVSPT